MFQWRILMVAHKLIVCLTYSQSIVKDVNPRMLESKGHPLYLQYRFGEYVTRFQLSHQGEPVKIVIEKVKTQGGIAPNEI